MRMNGGSTTPDARVMQIRNIAPTESGFAARSHVEHPYLNLQPSFISPSIIETKGE